MTQSDNLLRVVNLSNSPQDGQRKRIPELDERLSEELVVALVGPMGSGCTTTGELLGNLLRQEYWYEVTFHKLSSFLSSTIELSDKQGAERTTILQGQGDKLRTKYGNDYLAAMAIQAISQSRNPDPSNIPKMAQKYRRVYIIDSLKHPDELDTLRRTYGEILWLIGVFAPLDVRKKRLQTNQQFRPEALDELFRRDYEEDSQNGQKVRKVFHEADLFIRNDQDNVKLLEKFVARFVEILFGHPVHTPTTSESAMYSAYAEAAKSACLSRQVGAAIVSEVGEEVIGLGRNDVPAFGGGLYQENHGDGDFRCHSWLNKICHNDRRKGVLYQDIFQKLNEAGLLSQGVTEDAIRGVLKKTDIRQLIEYSRAVHAEMDAITSVARSGRRGLVGGSMYVTTFPCHTCARHIVASGIRKVYFIEPYPKSLAMELHSDAISDVEGATGKVLFLQYSGIAPKNILKLFYGSLRKQDDGKIRVLDKKTASPVVAVSLDDYTVHELQVVSKLATVSSN